MTAHPVETILEYQFSNPNLLNEALLAAGASVSSKDIHGDPQGNKRLALLGDSVLQEAILEPWYSSGESTEKGSNKVKNLARNSKLSKVAHESGLANYIAKNPCQLGDVPQETAASTVEAVVGAVYLDCGKDIATVKKVLKAINFYQAT
ncbi:ribonuclease III [Byssothecium circinans]|uniref:Ribonuclease III n=1 Tax=Byssothecium circinans TaxID=147558 RepID=A0A6A5T6A4_9PLEO|nr:ribonuclease III [Byssothecium circinans]